MPKLSDDAKALMGAWFGIFPRLEVSFHMRESRPTPRCQKAIDELIAAGAVRRSPCEGDAGAFKLTSCGDTKPYAKWMAANIKRGVGEFTVVEPIKREMG